jgi:hypothetical protein
MEAKIQERIIMLYVIPGVQFPAEILLSLCPDQLCRLPDFIPSRQQGLSQREEGHSIEGCGALPKHLSTPS